MTFSSLLFLLFHEHSMTLHNIPQPSMTFCNVPWHSMSFHHILQGSISFHEFLKCSRMFHDVLLVSMAFLEPFVFYLILSLILSYLLSYLIFTELTDFHKIKYIKNAQKLVLCTTPDDKLQVRWAIDAWDAVVDGSPMPDDGVIQYVSTFVTPTGKPKPLTTPCCQITAWDLNTRTILKSEVRSLILHHYSLISSGDNSTVKSNMKWVKSLLKDSSFHYKVIYTVIMVGSLLTRLMSCRPSKKLLAFASIPSFVQLFPRCGLRKILKATAYSTQSLLARSLSWHSRC